MAECCTVMERSKLEGFMSSAEVKMGVVSVPKDVQKKLKQEALLKVDQVRPNRVSLLLRFRNWLLAF